VKINFLLTLLTIALTSSAFAQAEELPQDPSITAMAVHGVKFPLSQKFSMHTGLVRFYGERLLTTYGLELEPRYNFDERNAIALPIYILTSSASGSGDVASDYQTAADPSLALGPVYSYNPVYGKFVLNDQIYHFRAGFNAGLLAMQLKQTLGGGYGASEDKKLHFGVQGGLQMQVQFGENWTLEIFSNLLNYDAKGASSSQDSGNRLAWLYGLKIGYTF
jgi:hypothetical protein